MPVFDAYMMVDWSASAQPRQGPDSVWICLREREGAAMAERLLANPPTRDVAMGLIADKLSDLVARGRRVLVGFDLGFGYPQGFAQAIGAGDWRGVWREIARRVADGPDNANNRFEVAAAFNGIVSGKHFPFWGHPAGVEYDGLSARRPAAYGPLAEFRLCERRLSGPQPVWKMAYAGSVGGQTLLGIPRLRALREHPWISEVTRVWPFETGLRPLERQDDWRVVLAEVYPSMLTVPVPEGSVKDAQQVTALARHFAELDAAERLGALFAGDEGLSAAERAVVEREEGWILGVTGRPPVPDDYIRDPDAIYAASVEAIRRECDLSGIPDDLQALAIRVVHACGMPDVASDLVFSPGAGALGRQALQAGAPVLVDAEMVAYGVIRRLLPAGNPVICTLNDAKVPDLARKLGTTRSAAALELWRERMGGAVVAIGNAPTALFRLLEMVAQGAPKPALVLGFPVGFVGAAESKAALAANTLGIPYVALSGRRGGSAMAAAAVNALAGGMP